MHFTVCTCHATFHCTFCNVPFGKFSRFQEIFIVKIWQKGNLHEFSADCNQKKIFFLPFLNCRIFTNCCGEQGPEIGTFWPNYGNFFVAERNITGTSCLSASALCLASSKRACAISLTASPLKQSCFHSYTKSACVCDTTGRAQRQQLPFSTAQNRSVICLVMHTGVSASHKPRSFTGTTMKLEPLENFHSICV